MKMSRISLILVFTFIFALAGCEDKKPAAPQKAAKCTGKCPDGQTHNKECVCVAPPVFKPDAPLQAQLLEAVAKDNRTFITSQLNKGLDINAPLGFGAMDNFLAFRETLQKSGFIYDNIRKDINDMTLLFFAVSLKKTPVVDILLTRRADVNLPSMGRTPLKAALINKDAAAAAKLLDRGARPDLADLTLALNNKEYPTAALIARVAKANNLDIAPVLPDLVSAVAANDMPLITFLLDNAHVSPDVYDAAGRPLMISAALGGNANVVKLLLAAGATVDMQDNSGFTTLMRLAAKASDDKDLILMQYLLDNKASVNSQDNAGYNVLYHAMRGDNPGAAGLLIHAGADVNALSGENDQTAIFTAAQRGNLAMVKLLIDNGALTRIKDRHGKTPAKYAVERGHMAVYDLLEKQKE